MSDYFDYLTNSGISDKFILITEILRKPLDKSATFSTQIYNDLVIQKALQSLSTSEKELEFVLAGWIDQAVLEVPGSRIGNKETLMEMSSLIDEYRPDQNGNIALYIATGNWMDVLEIEISQDYDYVSGSVYKKKQE